MGSQGKDITNGGKLQRTVSEQQAGTRTDIQTGYSGQVDKMLNISEKWLSNNFVFD